MHAPLLSARGTYLLTAVKTDKLRILDEYDVAFEWWLAQSKAPSSLRSAGALQNTRVTIKLTHNLQFRFLDAKLRAIE